MGGLIQTAVERRGWKFINEPVGVGGMGGEQSLMACELDGLGEAVMNAVRGVKADSRMMMMVVIPVEEGLAEAARVVD